MSLPPVEAEPSTGRRRIMDVASDRFLAQGYAESSLRDIAAEVGMKAASLYYHFSSKEDLLTAILRQGMEVMVSAFERVDDDLVPYDRLRAHVRAHLEALFEHGSYTAAHVTTFHTAPSSVRVDIVPLRDEYEAMWSELFRHLAGEGWFAASTDLHLSRLILFGSMNSTVEWFHPDQGELDELADAIAEQFWVGVTGSDS